MPDCFILRTRKNWMSNTKFARLSVLIDFVLCFSIFTYSLQQYFTKCAALPLGQDFLLSFSEYISNLINGRKINRVSRHLGLVV